MSISVFVISKCVIVLSEAWWCAFLKKVGETRLLNGNFCVFLSAAKFNGSALFHEYKLYCELFSTKIDIV